MSQLSEEAILPELASIVSRYSGKSKFSPDGRLYADLGINGSDFIELVEEIEARFGIDLNEVSPKGARESAKDVSTKELASLLATKLSGVSSPRPPT